MGIQVWKDYIQEAKGLLSGCYARGGGGGGDGDDDDDEEEREEEKGRKRKTNAWRC